MEGGAPSSRGSSPSSPRVPLVGDELGVAGTHSQQSAVRGSKAVKSAKRDLFIWQKRPTNTIAYLTTVSSSWQLGSEKRGMMVRESASALIVETVRQRKCGVCGASCQSSRLERPCL